MMAVDKNFERARRSLASSGIDAWLVYDFRGNNDVFWQLFERRASTTRRAFLLIPSHGRPEALVHELDRAQFPSDGDLLVTQYHTWSELDDWLTRQLRPHMQVALEYSSNCAIPTLSILDAGTVELIRTRDVQVVSSADLFQSTLAVWDAQAFTNHQQASRQVFATLQAALAQVSEAAGAGRAIGEHDVQEFILEEFGRYELETEDRPIVAANQHSGDPHYEPTRESSCAIGDGDWLLIDLWARRPGPQNVYADITWVAYVGAEVPRRHQRVFEIVAAARDAVIERLRRAWERGEELMGWQLDDVARGVISRQGYGDRFRHRTGHSLGPGRHLHGLGVNLDNLETHDTRKIVPGVGFSVEPGVYLRDFGVRCEANVYIHPEQGPVVTTSLQSAVELLRP